MRTANHILSLIALSLGFLLAPLRGETALELFRCTPESAVAATTDTVTFTVEYKAPEGTGLYAWFAPLERRNAPPEFFEKTKLTIRKHASNAGYDNVYLVPYHLIPGTPAEGKEYVTLALDEFPPGKYTFAFHAKFIRDGVQSAHVLHIPLEVTAPQPPTRRTLAEGEQPSLKDYLIHVEADAPPSVKAAGRRLQRFVEKASGCHLPICYEALPPFIAVGDCAAARKAGIDAGSLDYDGYIIRKVGDDLFIAGRDMPDDGYTPAYGQSFGTSFGVNAFLEDTLGVHWLLPGERGIVLPKLDGDYRLPDLDKRYVPRYCYRTLRAWGFSPAVDEWLAFNQLNLSCGGSRYQNTAHSWVYFYPAVNDKHLTPFLLDREKTFREHPEFFELASDGRRVPPGAGEAFSLCLGNPATTQDIIQRIPKLVEAWAARFPYLKGMKYMTITPNDNAPYCACEECVKYRRKVTPEMTGGPVAYDLPYCWTELVFNHIRKVCEALPDYTFYCHIYHSTQFPYPGIQPMPKNFVASMAPLHCAYGPVRLCDDINATWHHWMESWRGIFADQVYYGLDFWLRQYYGAPLPSCIALMKDTFQELNRHPISGVHFYNNAGYGQSGYTTWVLLKMIWNPDLDPEELAAEWLRLAYGEKAAALMAELYRVIDGQASAYYNSFNGRSGWDMDAEILDGLYAPVYPQVEKLYLEAVAAAEDADQRWRLSLFGENLKLLRYTLVSLGLLEDTPSPLRLDAAGFDRLNRARMPNGVLWDYVTPPATPLASAITARVSCEITDELQGRGEYRPFSCTAHQEMLIVPREDGECELEIEGFARRYNEAKKRNYLPQIQNYVVYNADRTLYMSGMARNGIIRFPVEKGKLYRFVYTPQCDYSILPNWYLKRCSEPYAIGHHHDGNGFNFYDVKGPLWFYVEPGTRELVLYIGHSYTKDFDIDLKGPDGSLRASLHRKGISGATMTVEGAPEPGWWKLEFPSERGFCGHLRFGTGLTQYVVPDPANALKVVSADK